MNPAENPSRGRRGETIACDFLVREGYIIRCRNFHAPHGEIDIVASDGVYLVFVEVKTRKKCRSGRYGRPADAVTSAKKMHITSAAEQYLRENPTPLQPRFDVIEVYTDLDIGMDDTSSHVVEVRHFKSAFHAYRAKHE